MIYIVLGMHKSGTTLVAQTLHHAGIDMVEVTGEGVSYDDGNKYERQSVLELDMELLGATDHEVRALALPVPLVMNDDQRARMRAIIAACNAGGRDWGFKEPRATLTYPLWREELPEHRLIAIYRPPDEIWPRFRWQGWRRRYVNPLWAWQFLSRWMEHNRTIIAALRATPYPWLLMEYRELMTGPSEMRRLGAFVGRELPDRRRKELYRTRRPRTDLCLAFADRLMRVCKGYGITDIMGELAALRAQNLRGMVPPGQAAQGG